MNKTALRDAILSKLQAELEQQTAAAQSSREEATSEESRPENQYDMHSQEAAYLAEGQARFAAQIGENISHYASLPLPRFGPESAIALGAVVELSGGKQDQAWYFLGPRAGGLEVSVEGREILVITPQSPLGRELMGKHVGDTVQLPVRGRAMRVTSVE